MIMYKIFSILLFYIFINPSLGKTGFGPGNQEWGYVTVRPKAYMFWWLYYTTADVNFKYEEKPLIIWIQGGPAVSGTAYGNFEELGALDSKLNPRNHTWVKDYNVLFIDNPVGTGFSYVESLNLLSKTNGQIAKDLMECIRVFFQQFPKFSNTPTYILTESYGGKMSAEFANLWYKEQISRNVNTNFKGIGFIDVFISGEDVFKSWAPFLYTFGMIDSFGYQQIDTVANRFVDAVSASNWTGSRSLVDEIEMLTQKLTYHVDRYNIIKKVEPHYQIQKSDGNPVRNIYSNDLKKIMKKVRTSLSLKSVWGAQEFATSYALREDFSKPVIHHVEKLLNNTDLKVFVLNGQLDLIINTPSTLSWIEKMKWKYARKWKVAPRSPLVVNNIIEGYSKGYENFKFYMVERSGHMIPADNPVAMEPILKDLIYN